MALNIYYNNAEKPFEPKLVKMKENEKGQNIPGWMRLIFRDKNGNK